MTLAYRYCIMDFDNGAPTATFEKGGCGNCMYASAAESKTKQNFSNGDGQVYKFERYTKITKIPKRYLKVNSTAQLRHQLILFTFATIYADSPPQLNPKSHSSLG